MNYRKNNKKKILANLYEQADLREMVKIPSDIRPHYLSIIVHLPVQLREKLMIDAIDWINGWYNGIYHIQRNDSIHLTLVDIGRINNFKGPIEKIIKGIEDKLEKNKTKDLSFKLIKPEIGSSGINIKIEPTSDLKKLTNDLYIFIDENNIKTLEKRSISLIRYLIPEESYKILIKESLSKLENLEIFYNQQVYIDELKLVRLDKVAEYFQILHVFKLN